MSATKKPRRFPMSRTWPTTSVVLALELWKWEVKIGEDRDSTIQQIGSKWIVDSTKVGSTDSLWFLVQQKLVQQFTTWAANDDEDTNIANAPREQRKQIYLRSFAASPHRIQVMLEVFTFYELW